MICTATGGKCLRAFCNDGEQPGECCNGCMFYTRISEPIEVEDKSIWQQRYEGLVAVVAELLEDWQNAEQNCADAEDAFSNAIAAFEELAGRFNSLQAHVENPPQRAVPDGYILKAKDGYVARKPRRSAKFGGWYLCGECGEPHDNPPGPCPRRSKSVRTEAPPTTEIPPAVSESPARSGDVLMDIPGWWRCLSCGVWVRDELAVCTDCHNRRTLVKVEAPPEEPMCDCGHPKTGHHLDGELTKPCREATCWCADYRPDTIHPEGLAVCRWEVGRWGI